MAARRRRPWQAASALLAVALAAVLVARPRPEPRVELRIVERVVEVPTAPSPEGVWVGRPVMPAPEAGPVVGLPLRVVQGPGRTEDATGSYAALLRRTLEEGLDALPDVRMPSSAGRPMTLRSAQKALPGARL